MKRVRSSNDLEAFADIPGDVLECVLCETSLEDWKNLSLVCKRFYEVTRRKRCIQQWRWCITDTTYFEIRQKPWFTSINAISVLDYCMITLLELSGLEIYSVLVPNNCVYPRNFEWPKTVKSLVIGGVRDNYILPTLPDTLERLTIISIHFNQPFTTFPPNLKSLRIDSSNFDQNLDHLPDTLKELYIIYAHTKITKFPPRLKYLNIRSAEYIGTSLSKQLKSLKLLQISPEVPMTVNLVSRFITVQIGNITIKT
jgi:hypothetical protein